MAEDTIPTGDAPEEALSAFVAEDDAPEKPEREERADAAPEREEKPKEDEKVEEEAPRTYKAKANGREIEIPADQVDTLAKTLGVDPGVIVRGAQMFRAGQEKSREAAETLKRAEALAEQFKKDPRAALLGAISREDALKVAVGLVREQMEEDELRQKNPEELARRQAQAELDRLKADKEALVKEAEEREVAAYQDQVAAKVSAEIQGALESAGLPKEPYLIRRLASYIHDHVSAENVDDLTIADYLPVVLDEIAAEHTQFLGKLSGEELIERFPDMAEKVRDAFTKRVRRGSAPPRQAKREERPDRPKQPKAYGRVAALDAFLNDD